MQKHLLKKSLPAALVAGSLAGLCAQQAAADAILFPYLSTQANVLSFVTIVNDGTHFVGTPTGTVGYHFTYGHKAVIDDKGGVKQRSGCSHYNGDGSSTPNDMMTFEISGRVSGDGGNQALFEGPGGAINAAAGVTSTPVTLPVAGQLAFLAVESFSQGSATNASVAVGLFGWAEVIDTPNNVRIAYSTHNYAQNTSDMATPARADFSNVGPNQYVAGSASAVVLSWFPTSLVSTTWTVLPLGTVNAMSTPAGGSLRKTFTINAEVNSANVGGALNAVWDRDETSYSGARTKLIRCLGTFTRESIMQAGALAMTVNGGYTYLISSGSVTTAATDADDPGATYDTATAFIVHRTQETTTLTGISGSRTFVNREPHTRPAYTP